MGLNLSTSANGLLTEGAVLPLRPLCRQNRNAYTVCAYCILVQELVLMSTVHSRKKLLSPKPLEVPQLQSREDSGA